MKSALSNKCKFEFISKPLNCSLGLSINTYTYFTLFIFISITQRLNNYFKS